MHIAIGIYAVIYTGIAIIALLSWFVWDKRYKKGNGQDVPKAFQATDEVIIDPVSGKRSRVYYNPQTGERFYFAED